jgi:hypothetical protein
MTILSTGMRMSPGTDLTAVALPVLPARHRWVISRKTKLYDGGWGGGSYKGLGIALQELKTRGFGKPKWKNLAVRKIDPVWLGVGKGTETLIQCAERLAREIYDQRIKDLERLLEVESIIGVY